MRTEIKRKAKNSTDKKCGKSGKNEKHEKHTL